MVSADAGTVTVQYTRHSHHHRMKSSIPPDQLGTPYPSLTILYQVHHVSLGGISCSGMRLILGGIKKSLVMVLGGGDQHRGSTATQDYLEVNGDFFFYRSPDP